MPANPLSQAGLARARLWRKRLTQCLPLAALNSVIPLSGLKRHEGLVYGAHQRHRLDLYAPKDAAAAPVVVFFYGGRWIDGRRRDYRFVGEALASLGFAVLIPDYRLHPEVTYPAFIEDGAEVLTWLEAQGRHYGADPTRVALMGHSAGAHSALMLSLHRAFLQARGVPVEHIRAGIGLSGPYDFLPMTDEVAISAFGEHSESPEGQPITHVHEEAPPLLLIHGLQDTVVSPGNAKRLASALRHEGGEADVLIFPKAGHIAPLISLARPLRWLAPSRDGIAAFLARHLRGEDRQRRDAA